MRIKHFLARFMVVLCLAFAGCRSPNVIFTTNTSIGLDVSGTGTTVPNHVSVAYNREEVIYVPKETQTQASVYGKLDSELTWMNGIAVREEFATGDAAKALSEEGLPPEPCLRGGNSSPMLVLTGTRFGLSLDFGQANMNAASFLAGYRRFNVAIVPPRPGSDDIQPVYADISIHGSGLSGTALERTDPSFTDRKLTGSGGVRIVQTVATGRAATRVVSENRKAINDRLMPDQFKNPISKYRTINTIVAHYEPLSSAGQARFVAFLSELDNDQSRVTTLSDIRARLHGLSDEQRGKALAAVQQLYDEEKGK